MWTKSLPSALSLSFFLNQDWTWGIALMVSGAFIAFALIKFGTDRFRREQVNSPGGDVFVGSWYNYVIQYAVPTQVAVLITWWFWQAVQAEPDRWWNPFVSESVGTCIFQWLAVILILVALNKTVARRTLRE